MKPLVFTIDDGSALKHVVEVGEQEFRSFGEIEGGEWLAQNTYRLLAEAELRAIGGKSMREFDEEGGAE